MNCQAILETIQSQVPDLLAVLVAGYADPLALG